MNHAFKKAMLAAESCVPKGNKESIRIPIQITRASGPMQDGPQEAVVTETNPIYGGQVGGIQTGVEATAPIWIPGLIHKTIQIYADAQEINSHPVRVQINIRGSDAEQDDWVTLDGPIRAPGIYKIVVPTINTIPTYFEPEATLLRLIGYYNEDSQQVVPLPVSLNAVLAALWMGEGPWTMRCTANYSRS